MSIATERDLFREIESVESLNSEDDGDFFDQIEDVNGVTEIAHLPSVTVEDDDDFFTAVDNIDTAPGFSTVPTEEDLVKCHPELAEEPSSSSDDWSDVEPEIPETENEPVIAESVSPCNKEVAKEVAEKELIACEKAIRRSDLSLKLSIEQQNISEIQVRFF